MVNIALFGTSADPPTCAHQAILQWLSHHYDQVVVWASDNPFKSHQTTLEQRSHMLKLLIEEIDPYQNPIRVSPDLSSPRTLETIALVKQHWGLQANLTLVIGTDLVRQMPRWYQIEQLLKQVQLLVIPRSGYGVDQASLEKLKHLGAQLAIANITVPSVSSTAYRENGDTTALTPLVKDYIHQEQLYQ
ncbi:MULTISPECIES: nicotinate-nucleotide adenylyltransferase [unclassified Moorena]|uniref:nicotinate-nucleotide adenylyltransferase n=1 Tax=unclassified Moorena TaxID=2683338 RepID=UPI0014000BCF|nr:MULTISPECIES: nicotinate-nucleotide adenylyltransferase [unclassified Moorena]NEO13512.1 nicotinate-nucleotide adenylyltransferase [Moorena sp. SIO3E8]NEP98507.1 nicotinate-nucleotide adenylyltransferase [Moorena sp. SIO3F7]